MRGLIAAFIAVSIATLVVMAQGAGDAAKGQAAYVDRKCGTCHKINKDDAKGGKLSTILADNVGKLSAADMRAWLTDTAKMEAKLPKKPIMPMSTFLKSLKPGLNDAEVNNLIAYLQTLPGK
jgi:cytochrome c2